MNRISKPLLAAIVAVGALAATTAAQARSDVVLSIGVNAPYGYVQPAPVYVQPQPVYMQPRVVYVQPEPVYYEQRSYRHHRHHGAWRDADRDGVPNRYDRAPNNPYRY